MSVQVIETYDGSIEYFMSPFKKGFFFSDEIPDIESEGFFITAPIQSMEFYTRDILERNFHTAFGKELRLEHVTPDINVNSFLGYVTDTYWCQQTDMPAARIFIGKDTEVQRKVRKILVEDMEKPLEERHFKGVSVGVLEKREDNLVKSIFIREISLTENPRCKECVIQDVKNFSENVVQDIPEVLLISEEHEEGPQKVADDQDLGAASKIAEYAVKMEKLEDSNKRLLAKIEEYEERDRRNGTYPVRYRLVSEFAGLDPKTEEGKEYIEELAEFDSKALAAMEKIVSRVKKLMEYSSGDLPKLTGGDYSGAAYPDPKYNPTTAEGRSNIIDEQYSGSSSGYRPIGGL